MPKLYQLFKYQIPDCIIDEVILCFVDWEWFSKIELQSFNTVMKLQQLIHKLKPYYLNCKHFYLEDLNMQKCICILRQIIKFQKKIIICEQRYVRHRKVSFYKIQNLNEVQENNKQKCCFNILHENIILNFQ